MGMNFKWECSECNYSAEVSGKRDRGFRSFTETYLCKSCQTIMDESYQLAIDGNPIKKIIFSPLSYWLIKKTINVYREIDKSQIDLNSIYVEEFKSYFILSERIIKRPESLVLFDIFQDDISSDGTEKIGFWYKLFRFKKVEFPVVNIYHFIPQCNKCKSKNIIIWENHVCPKCGGEMIKGKLTLLWD
jgi:hypothetical protein